MTSKLNNGFHRPDDARRAFDRTLSELGFDYVDLFLIHWPLPTLYDGDYVSTWKTLEEFKADGRARSIGVSNFQVEHLERLAAETDTVPAVNQIELHPYFLNEDVARPRRGARDRHRGVVADRPGRGARRPGDHRDRRARRPGRRLRWSCAGTSSAATSSSRSPSRPERIRENFEIFDFELDAGDLERIAGLDRGEDGRTGPNPDRFAYVPG